MKQTNKYRYFQNSGKIRMKQITWYRIFFHVSW